MPREGFFMKKEEKELYDYIVRATRQKFAEQDEYFERFEHAENRSPDQERMERLRELTWNDILAAVGDGPCPPPPELRKEWESPNEQKLKQAKTLDPIIIGELEFYDGVVECTEHLRRATEFYEWFGGKNKIVNGIFCHWSLRSIHLGLAAEAQALGKSEACQSHTQIAHAWDGLGELFLGWFKSGMLPPVFYE
jgi:hypothetical protein